MALSIEPAPAPVLRHVVARSRGRRPIFPDAASRERAARRLAEACARHRLTCLVWSVTERCLHFVVRGQSHAITLATDELVAARLGHGYFMATPVQPDLYLLEVARHVLAAPVRAGHCRRAMDWPCSSARESLGFAPPPPWLDPGLLYELLGPRDGREHLRLRRYVESG